MSSYSWVGRSANLHSTSINLDKIGKHNDSNILEINQCTQQNEKYWCFKKCLSSCKNKGSLWYFTKDSSQCQILTGYFKVKDIIELNVNDRLLNIKDEANKKLNELEERILNYNEDVQNEVETFKTETIKFYDNKILELNNTINDLNNKIFELETVLEDILNEDWYNKW